jgi:ATP-dependent helicase/nuclease subunit B
VRDRWETFGTPIQLQLSDFDSIVADALEQQFYETREQALSAEQRQRLVEAAVDNLDDPAHPLATNDDAASADACSQAEDLLSLLEFAGLTTPGAIQDDDRLQAVSPNIRNALTTLSGAFDRRRGTFTTGSTEKTLRSERYQRVLDAPAALSETLSTVDVVVLGPFSIFSPLEASLIDAIADYVDTIHAILPLADPGSDSDLDADRTLAGIDRGAERAWQRYADLGFTAVDAAEPPSPGAELADQLYRYTPTGSIETADLEAAGVEWHTYPTPAHEVRGTARELRAELADGRDADRIGVVVPGAADRQRELFETFEQYSIPVQVTEEIAVANTEVGAVLDQALRISAGDGRVQDLLRLIDNPLVEPAWPGHELTASDLIHLTDRVEVARLDALADILADQAEATDVIAAVDWVVQQCQRLADTPSPDTRAGLTETLTSFGVIDAAGSGSWTLAETQARESWVTDRETAALRALDRMAHSLEASADIDNRVVGDRLSRALASTTVEATLGDRAGVTVVSPGDVLQYEFDVVVALGLTQDAFPGQPARLAFTRQVNDAHRDFEPTDPTRQARHGLGLIPAQVDHLIFSHPAQTADGDETVVADLLAELQRICTDDLQPTKRSDDSHPPRCREDIQRSAATVLEHAATTEDGHAPTPDAVAAQLAAANVFTEAAGDPATRLQSGVACAAARQAPETTEYDGWLSSETVAQFPAADAPLSPSRIDTFATCGFKFYAEYLLDYSPPDDYTLESDARATGQFVHEVLARFFQSLQSTHGEPITIENPERYHDALYQAAQTELSKPYISRHDSTFQDGLLTRLLAGLNPDETANEYDGPPGYQGLFVRVLEALAAEHDQVTIRPALFEAAIGVDAYDGEATTRLRDRPVELIEGLEVRGKVDRVDVVPDTQPREFVAVDYKTGSSPTIDKVRQGASFQLPLYLRLLEATLTDHTGDEWTPIGAVYYDLDIPGDAGLQNTPLTTTEQAAYHQHDGKPLLRISEDQLFDDEDAFHEFLFGETDRRLTQLAEGLEDGVFHPTLLEADDANCEYCDYAQMCAVRHHHRHDRLSNHGRDAAYVPDYAQPSEDTQ